MAKLHTQVARKAYKCSKCGGDIKPGEKYYRIVAQFEPIRFRCRNCKPRQSELHSGYLADIYGIYEDLDDWENKYTDNLSLEAINELLAILSTDISILENMADEMEEKADNIEAYFTSSELADTLWNRADGARGAKRQWRI